MKLLRILVFSAVLISAYDNLLTNSHHRRRPVSHESIEFYRVASLILYDSSWRWPIAVQRGRPTSCSCASRGCAAARARRICSRSFACASCTRSSSASHQHRTLSRDQYVPARPTDSRGSGSPSTSPARRRAGDRLPPSASPPVRDGQRTTHKHSSQRPSPSASAPTTAPSPPCPAAAAPTSGC
jgi:hypothetical protein